MKPIYLLLLLLLACGFFACTHDSHTSAVELAPQPEDKTMNATHFVTLSADLEELGIFSEDETLFEGEHGSEDFRLYLDDEEGRPTVDFLTASDGLDDGRSLEEILALRPVRNWSSSITLRHQPQDARRFQAWLTDNFSGNVYVDIRLTILENGNMRFSGLKTSAADLVRYSEVPLFGIN